MTRENIKGVTQQLVDFTLETDYRHLPEAVAYESKRVLLDSIGCAIGGLATDKGKFSVKLAMQFGGPPESIILGTCNRVSCSGASFANGELINALDYDATLAGHHTPQVIPAPLALAEKVKATGKELITAIAIAFEISARLAAVFPRVKEVVKDGQDQGKVYVPPVRGVSYAIFGGTAGAGKILKLDRTKMAHAMGIAGFITPVPSTRKYLTVVPATMTKYALSGWVSQAEITSVLLAEMGYIGDPEVLDGEYGFWRFYIPDKWDPEVVTQKLGETWHVQAMGYKHYPSCRGAHNALDCFISLIEANHLMPDDIKHVTAWVSAASSEPLWLNRKITSHVDAQFSVAYVFSVAAHRIKPADWQDLDSIMNPRVLEFMDKVRVESDPGWGKELMKSPGSFPSSVEIVTKSGKVLREERQYLRGGGSLIGLDSRSLKNKVDPASGTTRMTDDELVEKFQNNVSRALPSHQIDKAAECLLNLEKLEDVGDLIKLISL